MAVSNKAKDFRTALGKSAGANNTPISKQDTFMRWWTEFRFDCEGNHRTDETIGTYYKHFHKLCEFIGYYTRVRIEGIDIDYKSTR